MSFYTVFDQKEPVVTFTTTSVLQGSDPVLIASSKQGHASQTTVGSISVAGLIATNATTLTTATAIPAQGLSTINCTSAGAVSPTWTLADPLAAGIMKTLFNLTTTTSTALTINFTSATGISTDVATGTISCIQFTGAYGAYWELQASSTSQWIVVGRSAAGTKSS